MLARILPRSSVGVLVALTSIALAGCGTPSFPAGPGTATLTWHSVEQTQGATPGAPQPYSGTVAGIPVSGRSTPDFVPGPGGGVSFPERLTLARWTGSFLGHAFALTVTFLLAKASPSLGSFTVNVAGTWGSRPVRFTAEPGKDNSSSIHFQGTVGQHHVTGSVGPPRKAGASNEATATFTVTG
jgi:hypothetical protein